MMMTAFSPFIHSMPLLRFQLYLIFFFRLLKFVRWFFTYVSTVPCDSRRKKKSFEGRGNIKNNLISCIKCLRNRRWVKDPNKSEVICGTEKRVLQNTFHRHKKSVKSQVKKVKFALLRTYQYILMWKKRFSKNPISTVRLFFCLYYIYLRSMKWVKKILVHWKWKFILFLSLKLFASFYSMVFLVPFLCGNDCTTWNGIASEKNILLRQWRDPLV